MVVSPVEGAFDEIVELIRAAGQHAARAVNTELIELYWRIGDYLHRKIESDGWAKGTVVQLAAYIAQRELERQFRLAAFERAVLHPPRLSPAVRQDHGAAASVFKNAYVVEFLNLPDEHSEADLHRGLNCLVAIELKVDRFEPEYLDKLGFYLEALDRDARKPHGNPAIGLLLCASTESEVVEYALSRTLSPALIAEYQTQLPDKKLLAAKLHEFYALKRRSRPGPSLQRRHRRGDRRNDLRAARVPKRQCVPKVKKNSAPVSATAATVRLAGPRRRSPRAAARHRPPDRRHPLARRIDGLWPGPRMPVPAAAARRGRFSGNVKPLSRHPKLDAAHTQGG
jgi:YhcG PDDEXK nuclease domain/DUF1016 N-terminal domain